MQLPYLLVVYSGLNKFCFCNVEDLKFLLVMIIQIHYEMVDMKFMELSPMCSSVTFNFHNYVNLFLFLCRHLISC